jgi:uncharacterized membrane protein YphA (DoxX/SURF4 family)
MSVVRRIARPMLASIFISGGIEALRNPQPRAKRADSVAPKLASALPVKLPQDTEQLVRIDGAVKVIGGLMLATSRMPRIAAIALAGSLVPTTFAGHPFWEYDDPAQRANQQNHFLKNAGLLGGLLLVMVDTEGRPSLGWRARRAAGRAREALPIG